MSPPNLPATQLRNQIFYHLDTELLETANFLAGRLHALEPRSSDSHHLLALTYFRLRRYKAAYDFSQKYGANGRHLGCAYIFAQSCLSLGESGQNAKFLEGTSALEKCKGSWVGKSHWKKVYDTSRRCLPDAAACWTLLGRLYRAHGDVKKAGDCYIEAHKSNPFVWDAFEGLCKVGADLKVEKMFQPTAEMGGGGFDVLKETTQVYEDQQQEQREEVAKPLATQLNFNQQVFTPSADPFGGSGKLGVEFGEQFALPGFKEKSAAFATAGNKAPLSDWDTPTTVTTSSVLDEDVAMGGVMLEQQEDFVPAAPARKPRAGQPFEGSERPRQPTLRVQPSESNEDSAQSHIHQRKPSAGAHKRTISGQHAAHTAANAATDSSAAPQPARRSNRLFGQTSSTKSTASGRSTAMDSTAASVAGRAGASERPAKTATGAKGRIESTVGRVVSGNRKMLPPDRNEKEATKRAPSRNAVVNEKPPSRADSATANTAAQQKTTTAQTISQPPTDPSQAEQEATTTLLDNFRDLAIGVYSTSRFDTPLTIRTFRSLPTSQRETPWVLSQLGKAYYESGDHKQAEECFARVLKLQPSRIEDMDVYSTVLWHLKKDTALTFLCHTLAEIDYQAPERWVAVGNAFSLSREHDQAITAFKRATQINDNFAYAWTLMGHEYIANEEFDTALAMFRKAVSVDRRGYGGWYGLGRSYEKMGKLQDAEQHYRIAASINPSNSTLLVCIGVVLERQRNKKGALANYSRALELAPSSALARFKKARCLMHLRLFAEALEELECLRDQAPDEANVWFLLGKCYKGLGERGEALRSLTTALNLDVKAAPFIKEAMEALDEDDVDESDDD